MFITVLSNSLFDLITLKQCNTGCILNNINTYRLIANRYTNSPFRLFPLDLLFVVWLYTINRFSLDILDLFTCLLEVMKGGVNSCGWRLRYVQSTLVTTLQSTTSHLHTCLAVISHRHLDMTCVPLDNRPPHSTRQAAQQTLEKCLPNCTLFTHHFIHHYLLCHVVFVATSDHLINADDVFLECSFFCGQTEWGKSTTSKPSDVTVCEHSINQINKILLHKLQGFESRTEALIVCQDGKSILN